MPQAEASSGEFALIERFFRGLDHGAGVLLGNGDDAALLTPPPGETLAVSTDTMVNGVHFPGGSPAVDVAYRAVAAAASDLAAMGASPLAMTLALTLPAIDEVWLGGCRRGLEKAVADFALPLVGGDLARGPLSLNVQVMGAVPAQQALRRDGARPGDRLFVSGALGAAAAGLALIEGRLSPSPRGGDALRRAFWHPQPALELGQALRGRASAAIDVSDGLLADAGHIARASGVRIAIESRLVPVAEAVLRSVPREQALNWALGGGEDYVLCFSQAPELPPPAGAVCIGEVQAGAGVHCDHRPPRGGYRHF